MYMNIFFELQAGKSFLEYALEGKCLEIAALLIQHPSCTDVNLTDAVSDLLYNISYF